MRFESWALASMLYLGAMNAHAAAGSLQGVPDPGPPTAWELRQNDPNPFCTRPGSTRIEWAAPQAAHVRLVVLSSDGTTVLRTLQDGDLVAGLFTLIWDGRDASNVPLADGTYPYRLTATGPTGPILFEATRTATVLCDELEAQPETWSGVRQLYR